MLTSELSHFFFFQFHSLLLSPRVSPPSLQEIEEVSALIKAETVLSKSGKCKRDEEATIEGVQVGEGRTLGGTQNKQVMPAICIENEARLHALIFS